MAIDRQAAFNKLADEVAANLDTAFYRCAVHLGKWCWQKAVNDTRLNCVSLKEAWDKYPSKVSQIARSHHTKQTYTENGISFRRIRLHQ
jgi:hypothetical protein